MTVEGYKAKYSHRPTASMERCQFCDNFVKPNGDEVAVKGGCKEMKKRCAEARFDTTEVSCTCDNFVNKEGKYI